MLTLETGQAVKALLPLFNSGDTPATITAWSTHFTAVPPDEDIAPAFSKLVLDKPRQGVVAPRTLYRNEMTGPVITDPAAVEQIKAGTRKLYVIGRVEYEDVLGETRLTQFCLEYMPMQNALYACGSHTVMQ
jgi:hypothetical protein